MENEKRKKSRFFVGQRASSSLNVIWKIFELLSVQYTVELKLRPIGKQIWPEVLF